MLPTFSSLPFHHLLLPSLRQTQTPIPLFDLLSSPSLPLFPPCPSPPMLSPFFPSFLPLPLQHHSTGIFTHVEMQPAPSPQLSSLLPSSVTHSRLPLLLLYPGVLRGKPPLCVLHPSLPPTFSPLQLKGCEQQLDWRVVSVLVPFMMGSLRTSFGPCGLCRWKSLSLRLHTVYILCPLTLTGRWGISCC